ncbi:MAG: glycosyltransferase [Fuerstiella sp.]
MRRSDAESYFSRMKTSHPTRLPESDHDADIIHLHWVGRWLDLTSFVESIPLHIPIVWTIHDMSPLAGGCISDFNCPQWEHECRTCPLLRSPMNRIWARHELKRRRIALQPRKLCAVANSNYTRRMTEKSLVFENPYSVHTIHPGIDVENYEAIETSEAKQSLGIPPGKFVVGFGAASVTDEIKGCDHFIATVNELNRKIDNLHVLIFGEGSPTLQIDAPLTELGMLKTQDQQSAAYSAMDAFVIASKMETFGQVASEAQACGTPTYAFDVGGLSDAISNGKTGGIVPHADCKALANLIREDRESGKLAAMADKCREWVSVNFSLEQSTNAYLDVYHSALSS